MHIAKWGNSLAVRLPKKLVEELDLKEGDEVELAKLGEGRIGVAKIDKRAAALKRMIGRGWKTPPGYKFDREEANER